ncbi:MAG: hypothetical protein KatS3mg001_130 [Candidatus Pacearchaeota archaeon]|nr:MAG: hypothetical protein KatS3mg001_130 [Candidatus Pacearchaeota archaeon]
MAEEVCPKCNNTGIVKEKSGEVHTCFDCLLSGRLDQHNKDLKSAEELRIKL